MTAPSRSQLHALPHRRDQAALACREQGPSGPVKARGQRQQFQGWGLKELSQRSPLKPRTGKGSMPDRARLMPLEFKSGRAHHTHRAQVAPTVLCSGSAQPRAGCLIASLSSASGACPYRISTWSLQSALEHGAMMRLEMRVRLRRVCEEAQGPPELSWTVPFCQACSVAFSLPGVLFVMELQHRLRAVFDAWHREIGPWVPLQDHLHPTKCLFWGY